MKKLLLQEKEARKLARRSGITMPGFERAIITKHLLPDGKTEEDVMKRLPSLMEKYYDFVIQFVVTGRFCPIAPDKVSSTRYFLIDYAQIEHAVRTSAPLCGNWFDSWQDLVSDDSEYSFFKEIRGAKCGDIQNDQFVLLFTDVLDWRCYCIVLAASVYYKKE